MSPALNELSSLYCSSLPLQWAKKMFRKCDCLPPSAKCLDCSSPCRCYHHTASRFCKTILKSPGVNALRKLSQNVLLYGLPQWQKRIDNGLRYWTRSQADVNWFLGQNACYFGLRSCGRSDGKVSRFDFSNRKSWASIVATVGSIVLPIKLVAIVADCLLLRLLIRPNVC